jgi:hypothetical protein
VFSDGNNVGACDFGNRDTAVGLVGSVEVNMVRTNTCCNCNLELFGFGKAFSGEVARVEASSIIRFEDMEANDCGVAYGVVMITSASTSSFSNTESSPSLSDVVTRVCPCSSIHFRMPSSFSVVPRSLGSCSAWIPP